MTLEFREVTEENFAEFIELEVNPEQKNSFFFKSTKPNIISLAQTYIYKGSQILAVYADGTMVGSIFYSRDDTEPSNFWLTRFMIDKRYQKKGYGRQAMLMLFDRVKQENGGEPVRLGLSYEPENTVAEKLYMNLGFEETGEMLGEQKVVRKELTSSENTVR
ncbi:MAG: GNAT family N-acetyltransferase [Euryarchaeota archaeon]|nr:GNAT family N-acetyltransferase [Euryarchaeota archaeon]MBU4032934.1 GNAT family N-acetyltransferase [Candidatus Thermoplasmatota archaeon]MBU4071174.1 GNAT family N-acetyltransferase [Candidatus Thermoplasmatota archaeon]MBU4143870.1 GNAT family N-acetyltransferase [Candidatus Thermoplasmatota archaeon]